MVPVAAKLLLAIVICFPFVAAEITLATNSNSSVNPAYDFRDGRCNEFKSFLFFYSFFLDLIFFFKHEN